MRDLVSTPARPFCQQLHPHLHSTLTHTRVSHTRHLPLTTRNDLRFCSPAADLLARARIASPKEHHDTGSSIVRGYRCAQRSFPSSSARVMQRCASRHACAGMYCGGCPHSREEHRSFFGALALLLYRCSPRGDRRKDLGDDQKGPRGEQATGAGPPLASVPPALDVPPDISSSAPPPSNADGRMEDIDACEPDHAALARVLPHQPACQLDGLVHPSTPAPAATTAQNLPGSTTHGAQKRGASSDLGASEGKSPALGSSADGPDQKRVRYSKQQQKETQQALDADSAAALARFTTASQALMLAARGQTADARAPLHDPKVGDMRRLLLLGVVCEHCNTTNFWSSCCAFVLCACMFAGGAQDGRGERSRARFVFLCP